MQAADANLFILLAGSFARRGIRRARPISGRPDIRYRRPARAAPRRADAPEPPTPGAAAGPQRRFDKLARAARSQSGGFINLLARSAAPSSAGAFRKQRPRAGPRHARSRPAGRGRELSNRLGKPLARGQAGCWPAAASAPPCPLFAAARLHGTPEAADGTRSAAGRIERRSQLLRSRRPDDLPPASAATAAAVWTLSLFGACANLAVAAVAAPLLRARKWPAAVIVTGRRRRRRFELSRRAAAAAAARRDNQLARPHGAGWRQVATRSSLSGGAGRQVDRLAVRLAGDGGAYERASAGFRCARGKVLTLLSASGCQLTPRDLPALGFGCHRRRRQLGGQPRRRA